MALTGHVWRKKTRERAVRPQFSIDSGKSPRYDHSDLWNPVKARIAACAAVSVVAQPCVLAPGVCWPRSLL